MIRSRFPAGLVALCLALTIFMAGCHSGTVNAITISLDPSTTQSLDAAHSLNYIAVLGGDINNKGVKWSLTLNNNMCNGDGCGTLSNITTHAVTYTAPNVSTEETFTLTATALDEPVITANATIQVQIAPQFTTLSIPTGAANGVPYQATINAIDGVQPLTYSIASGSLPAGLTLNPLSGAIVGTPTFDGPGASQTYNFSVQVTDFNGAISSNGPLALSITVAAPSPLSASAPLPPGVLGAAYSGKIATTGGVPPLTFGLVGNGTLPANLSLNSANGQITGVPTQNGTSTFNVQVTDSAVPTHQITTVQGAITVSTPSKLQITTTSLPNAATAAGYGALLQAQGGVPPYTWTLTSGQLPAGLTLTNQSDNTAKISGNPILAGTSTFTVQVQDSDANPQTVSAQYTIVTTSGSNTDSLFSGSYSFLFQGFDTNGPVTIAGTLTTDGLGNITAGHETSNRESGITVAALSGNYVIGLNGADGRGSLHLIATPSVQAALELDYQLVLQSDGSLRMIENNNTNTNTDTLSTHGAGVLKPVTQGSFSAGNLSGNYAFEFEGEDFAQKRMAMDGVLHADGQSLLSPITADLNDNGSLASLEAPSGNFDYSATTQSGVANVLFAIPGKAQEQITFAFYFVSPSDAYFVEADTPTITDQFPRLGGEAVLQQTGATFGAASLAGNSVVTGTGLDGSHATVMAGLLTAASCDGVTKDASLSYDQNDGGTISSPVTPAAVACMTASNGRVSFASLDPRVAVAYLTAPGQGFILGDDAAVTVGTLELQTPSAFAVPLIDGSYTLSAASPGDPTTASIVGQVSSTGNGSLPGVLDEIDPPGTPAHLGQSLLLTADSVSASGRGTMTSNSAAGFPTNIVLYMLSQTQIRMISLDSNPGKSDPDVISLNH